MTSQCSDHLIGVLQNSTESNISLGKCHLVCSLFGQKFACSITGLVACGVYCTVWRFVNPVAGVTCDIVCGAAFAVACF